MVEKKINLKVLYKNNQSLINPIIILVLGVVIGLKIDFFKEEIEDKQEFCISVTSQAYLVDKYIGRTDLINGEEAKLKEAKEVLELKVATKGSHVDEEKHQEIKNALNDYIEFYRKNNKSDQNLYDTLKKSCAK